MKSFVLALAATAMIAAPVAAAAPRHIAIVTVVMQDRAFHPQVIRLKRDQPTRIVLINRDVSGHNFDSKALFSHADIGHGASGEQAIHDGLVSVPSQSTREVHVTPRFTGSFHIDSSVALDVASGMAGEVVVY